MIYTHSCRNSNTGGSRGEGGRDGGYDSQTSDAGFLQRVRIACNALQSAVLARAILSVCLSVHHIPVFCPDE